MSEPFATELASITIGIDPYVRLGPITLAWHGITIAMGIVVGMWLAARLARERGLDADVMTNQAVVIVVAGLIGSRLFFLIETGPEALLRPGEWFGTRGFAFNGALILSPLAAILYLRARDRSRSYLDVAALAFPLAMAVGRIGDVINGEHHGAPTTLPWGVRNTHPAADVPSPAVAYHSGGLYEVVLALAIFALVWPLRRRFETPLMAVCMVVALYAVGRFLMFFYRSDSAQLGLGLTGAQWTSLALLGAAGAGALWVRATARHSSPQGAG